MTIPSSLPTPNATESFWLSELSAELKGYRGTEDIPSDADVAIIGSGISGAFAAREMLKNDLGSNKKLKVVMFEAREVCSGASGRNGGHCQPALYSGDAEITRLEMATYRHISQLIQDCVIQCDWQPRGAVAAFYSKGDFDRAMSKLEESKADMPEIMEHLQCVAADSESPNLRDLGVAKAKGAIINKMAASLWPYKMVAGVVEDLIRQNPEFNLQTNTPVQSIERDADDVTSKWHIHTSRGSCTVRHVLLATNGYTSHLLPGLKHIIQPVRGNMIAGRGGGELLLKHSYGLVDELSGEEYKELAQASERLVGDGEYLMQRPAEDHADGGHESPIVALGGARFMMRNSGYGLSDDGVIDQPANKFLRSRLGQVLDAVAAAPDDFKVTHEWTGILGYSKDGFPWVGELQDGLWLCAGYSGHGMPQAALCAAGVATMMLAKMEGSDARIRDARTQHVLPARFLITPERLKANGLRGETDVVLG